MILEIEEENLKEEEDLSIVEEEINSSLYKIQKREAFASLFLC